MAGLGASGLRSAVCGAARSNVRYIVDAFDYERQRLGKIAILGQSSRALTTSGGHRMEKPLKMCPSCSW
ncbi:hypothetical protein N9174_00395 [bacterium]|nr:hypothetical protein [bacterium]